MLSRDLPGFVLTSGQFEKYVHQAKNAKKNHGIIGSQPRIPSAIGPMSGTSNETTILLRDILGELRGIRADTETAREQTASAEINLYARNDLLLNRVEGLVIGFSAFGREIATGGLGAASVQEAGRQLHYQIEGITSRGDHELTEFMDNARKGLKRPGTLSHMAPRKRNKAVYGSPEESEEDDETEYRPARDRPAAASSPARTQAEIEAAAGADPPPPDDRRGRKKRIGKPKGKKAAKAVQAPAGGKK